MEDLLQLVVFLIAGGIGLVQWLQKRRRDTARHTASAAPHGRAAAATSRPRPALRRSAPARVPHRAAPPRPTRSSPFDTLDQEREETPSEFSLENVLSELLGGEPVRLPPRPPDTAPRRAARPPAPPPTPAVVHEPAPQPVAAAVAPSPAASAPPAPPSPTAGILHTLRGMHAPDWHLAVVLQEVLGPPVSMR